MIKTLLVLLVSIFSLNFAWGSVDCAGLSGATFISNKSDPGECDSTNPRCGVNRGIYISKIDESGNGTLNYQVSDTLIRGKLHCDKIDGKLDVEFSLKYLSGRGYYSSDLGIIFILMTDSRKNVTAVEWFKKSN